MADLALTAELASNLLLIVPALAFLYLFFTGKRDKAYTLLAAYMFLSGVTLLTKFVFKVPRPEGAETPWDPYAFPSYHTAMASYLFWVFPNVGTFVYATLMGWLRVEAGVHTWLDVIAGFFFAGLVWWLYRRAEKKVGRLEWGRQSIHMGVGSLIGFMLYLSPQIGLIVMIIGLIVGAFIFLVRNHPLIASFLQAFDRDFTGKGAFWFVIGAVIATLITPKYAWVAVWYLAYVDSVATMVGKYFQTKTKSWHGTFGGFVAGVLVGVATLMPGHSWILILLLAALASAVEYYSPIDDNVTIPVVIAIILEWLAPYLPF